jgi:hypothetical protein
MTAQEDSSDEARAVNWLKALAIYPNCSQDWPSHRQALTESYFTSVHANGLSNWNQVTLSEWSLPENFAAHESLRMQVIHYDVIRLGRLFPLFDDLTCSNQLLCRRFERILYVFGSVSLTYMQGFNELLVPIYYVLIHSSACFTCDDEIEATTLYCLHSLINLTGLRELFTTANDSSVLLVRLSQFDHLIEDNLPGAYSVITHLRIHPAWYSLKWFSLLFTQDHEFPEILKLWDVLFGHMKNLLDYVFLIGLGHVRQMEDKLNLHDLSETLNILQHPGKCSLSAALEYADQLWNDRIHQSCPRSESCRWLGPLCLCASSLLSLVWA